MISYPDKTTAIEKAQAQGSQATTVRGAVRYLLAHLPTPIPGLCALPASTHSRFAYRANRAHRAAYIRFPTARENWANAHRTARLIVRYAGKKRFPRCLTATDRAAITGSAAHRQIVYARTLPEYARALACPLDEARKLPRLSAEIGAWAKGVLAGTWPTIEKDAFNRAPFGSKRRVHRGLNSTNPGIRTESYDHGANPWGGKWTHNDYYADYALIVPVKRGRLHTAYYIAPDGSRHIVYVSPFSLRIGHDGQLQRRTKTQKEQRPLPVHIQRRFLSVHTRAVLHVDFDRENRRLMVVDSAGEQYHLTPVASPASARRQIKEAINALRKRRTEKRERDFAARALSEAFRVWVSLDDSYASGNCRSMSDAFAKERVYPVEGEIGALRGDVLLSIRDDAYTRRAVVRASRRYAA